MPDKANPRPAAATLAASQSRRELAVARVLDPARERAEIRVQAFLTAATELINSSQGQDFTVQEVIEKSGQSLRSFYQYFNGKHELLLALFEDSVRQAAAQLRETTAGEVSAADRVRRFAVEYYRLCQPAPKAKTPKKGFAPAFAMFAQQLLTEHPNEASRAFAPLTTLLSELLDAAAADGSVRSDVDTRRMSGMILQALMFHAFAATISGAGAKAAKGDPADEMWSLLSQGIAAR